MIAGDNAVVLRRGDTRARASACSRARDLRRRRRRRSSPAGFAAQPGPASRNATITLFDHSHAIASGARTSAASDYIAGGAGDDVIFGQLGDDVIQGDGSTALTVSATRDATNALVVAAVRREPATDGDDYVEGNGGNDLIFGNLGQDDLIGGSSTCSASTRRDAAARRHRHHLRRRRHRRRPRPQHLGDTAVDGHAQRRGRDPRRQRRPSTAWSSTARPGPFLTFNYDNYTTASRCRPRQDHPAGGRAASTTRRAARTSTGRRGHRPRRRRPAPRRVGRRRDPRHDAATTCSSARARTTTSIGGSGHDWISGGTGDDGVLGDDGRIYTSRNGTAEPLYGLAAATQTNDRHAGQPPPGDDLRRPGS